MDPTLATKRDRDPKRAPGELCYHQRPTFWCWVKISLLTTPVFKHIFFWWGLRVWIGLYFSALRKHRPRWPYTLFFKDAVTLNNSHTQQNWFLRCVLQQKFPVCCLQAQLWVLLRALPQGPMSLGVDSMVHIWCKQISKDWVPVGSHRRYLTAPKGPNF